MTVLVKYHREIVLAQCYISHYFGIVFTKLCVNVHVHVKKQKKHNDGLTAQDYSCWCP